MINLSEKSNFKRKDQCFYMTNNNIKKKKQDFLEFNNGKKESK